MKKLITLLTIILCLLFPVVVKGETVIINDEINLLTSEEVNELNKHLEEVSDKTGYQILVYITEEPTDDVEVQASEYFDSLGLTNGFTLLLNMHERMLDVTLMGEAQVYSNYISSMLDYIAPYMTNGDYFNGCMSFGDYILSLQNVSHESYEYVEQTNNQKQNDFPLEERLIIAGVGSGIITLIAMLIMYNKLKTEKQAIGALDYIVPNSFNLTRSNDMFTYRSYNRHYRPRENHSSSSGGYHSGTTSSGHSHSSGSRRF